MGPAVIPFPSLRAGKMVVIYMAQVQRDSNMSDICYYSEISPPSAFEWWQPCTVDWEMCALLIDPTAGYQ